MLYNYRIDRNLNFKKAYYLVKVEVLTKNNKYNIKDEKELVKEHAKLYLVKLNKTKQGKILKKEVRRYCLTIFNKRKGKIPKMPINVLKPKSKHKEKYHKYLLSKEWKRTVSWIKKDRKGKCEKCQSKKNLQVHHLTYKNIFKEKMEDLLLLCRNCHKKEHNL